MQVAGVIAAVVAALAVLGVVYFAWRIEQDVKEGASPIVPVAAIGIGALVIWLILKR